MACQTVQMVIVSVAMRFNHGASKIHAEATTDLVDGLEGNNYGVMQITAAGLVLETNEGEKHQGLLRALLKDRCPVGLLPYDADGEPTIDLNVSPIKGKMA